MKQMKNNADTAREILAHIDKFGIVRKDVVSEKKTSKRMSALPAPTRKNRMTLDLHGLHSEEAEIKLRAALHRCKETGRGELLIIHGYGLHSNPEDGPVLKNLVQNLLDNDFRSIYRTYRTASPKDGGNGATLVMFR